MTMTLEIQPQVQTELDTRQAAAHGIELEACRKPARRSHPRPAGSKKLSQRQLESTLHEMAQFSPKIPSLRDEPGPLA